MNIATHRKIYFWITGLILAAALGAIVFFGLPLDIDFTGGSLMQVSYQNERPALSDIQNQIAVVPLGTVSIRAVGTNAVAIRARTMTPAEHSAVLAVLSQNTSATELSYTSVGPTLGGQFANKALWAILAVTLAIILYIAFAFRKVSRPVPSWGYGITVVTCLLHDLVIPAGFFAVLAHFTGIQVDALFITALLALLGYSVNDTIVIFDRVREHLARNEKTGLKEEFETTVGKSISETMTRSINTSLTVALALLALVLFGAAATRTFALVMLVGVIAGTYSSILLAAPLLIPLAKKFTKK
ncbi:MAG: protein translocase subunit SecF [Candidatus Kaiserbacteria bacterium]|nr:protein translocase subunit SecF [Candidatus Kaiserbacteria bacterium]